jgi:glycosyltransferase involved in cell wall biosynthesis
MVSGATTVTYGALALRPGGSGVQTYIRELLHEIPDQLPGASLSAVLQRDAAAELPPTIAARRRPVVSGTLRAALGALPIGGCDVFHGLDVDIPVVRGALTVATVHDVSVIDLPSASGRFRAAGETMLVRHSLRNADLLISVSQFTAERIAHVSGRQSTVVELAPARWARPACASEIAAVRAKYDLPERFILQVGTVEPRKQVGLVAAAAADLDIPCVLAGSGSKSVAAPRGTLGLGYVDVADLPGLYGAATVTAYASKYEGFGLPPLEAMACGGAVVASAVGALPQIADRGAMLVSSAKVSNWTTAMRAVLFDADLRADLVANAVVAASKWTWRQTAERTVQAYRQAGVSW